MHNHEGSLETFEELEVFDGVPSIEALIAEALVAAHAIDPTAALRYAVTCVATTRLHMEPTLLLR